MKHLPITSENFKYIEESFKQWLDILGYAKQTVYSLPNMIREFFHWLEQIGITTIKEIKITHIKAYYSYIKQRPKMRHDGALSHAAINNQGRTLHLFMNYLRQSGRYDIPYIKFHSLNERKEKQNTLTPDEIKQLFAATYIETAKRNNPEAASRDRAMLSICYGCGLRRNEARCLNIHDVNLDKAIVHVKKGKGNKERLVPINTTNIKYLEDYLYNARPFLLKAVRSEALFISMRSVRLSEVSMNLRLRLLVQKTENPIIIDKSPTLHTLRHSIATHLLSNGMKLEQIGRFLGHSSLESTQIYTHLMNEET